jgi:flap endonuclease-1
MEELETYRYTRSMTENLSREFGESIRDVEIAKWQLNRKRFNVTLSEKEKNITKQFLKFLGIPYVVSSGEGEFVAASMAYKGIVDAVMSFDTDVLACRSPIMIQKSVGNTFEIVELKTLLQRLGIDEKTWIDLCIIQGTDFNNTIPSKKGIWAYPLLKQYRSIEALFDNNLLDEDEMATIKYHQMKRIYTTDYCPNTQISIKNTIPMYAEAEKFRKKQ